MAGMERCPTNVCGKKERGRKEVRGEEEGGERGAVTQRGEGSYFHVWERSSVSLYLMLLSRCHAPFELILKKIVYRGSQTRGRWFVNCAGLSAQDAPRPPHLNPLQGASETSLCRAGLAGWRWQP